MTHSYEQWKDKSVSFNGNIYPMSLSHQSLRNFDTFINFVQLYLLTIKTRSYTSFERLCLLHEDVFVGNEC